MTPLHRATIAKGVGRVDDNGSAGLQTRQHLGDIVIHVPDLHFHLPSATTVSDKDVPPVAVSEQRADRHLQALGALPDCHFDKDPIAVAEPDVGVFQIQNDRNPLLLDAKRGNLVNAAGSTRLTVARNP